jgi:hypothetical protein
METRSRMELLGCGKFTSDKRKVSEGAAGAGAEGGGGGGGLAAFGDGTGSGSCGV